MNLTEEPREYTPPFRLVARETEDDLDNLHARAHADYQTWKRSVIDWLHFEGKDPERLRGYSEETIRGTNYKIDQVMRWLWNEHSSLLPLIYSP